MKTLFVYTILLQFSSNIFCAPLRSEEEAKKIANNMMNLVAEEQYNEAFSSVKGYWPIPEEEVTNLAILTKNQLLSTKGRFGDVIETEFIRSDKIGKSYIRYIYIQKFEKHATRWQIVFYKPKESWLVNSVIWDDQTHELFNMP